MSRDIMSVEDGVIQLIPGRKSALIRTGYKTAINPISSPGGILAGIRH
jgi:hypothetical protein